MRKFEGRSALVKLLMVVIFTAVIGAIALVGNRQRAAASAFGPSQSHTNAPGEGNCTACHIGSPVNSGSGSVQISGVPATYSPGQTFNITVTASQADAVIYGFQMTAIQSNGQGAGTFALPSQGSSRVQVLQGIVGETLIRQYMEHTSDGLSNGQFGFNSWTFPWTAPAAASGKIDFYVASNSANSDGGPSGDFIYTATTSSLPAASIMVSVSGRVTTPNGTALRNARVVLTDLNNVQRSAITSSFGNYSFSNVLSSTTYILSAQSRRFRFAPMTLAPTGDLTDVNFIGLE